ncbi:GroES-like protein, partial [Glonium stellatum]
MANQAAWLPAKGAQLEVKESVLQKPGPDEVLIRNHAIALNPIDQKMQDSGLLVETFPVILGHEVAGEIEEVGEDVTKFSKGDRVVGLAIAVRTKNPAHAGFQLYTLAPSYIVAHIPPTLPYANAAALPIGLATAAAGLYEPCYLNLPPPGTEPPTTTTTATTTAKPRSILIWGGSSTVGSAAIQLARASNLVVVATASAPNLAYVRELGATHAFAHSGADVVEEVVAALEGTELVGAYDVISEAETVARCGEVLGRVGG